MKVHGASIVFSHGKKGNIKSPYTWCGLYLHGDGVVDSTPFMSEVTCKKCLQTWNKVYPIYKNTKNTR